MMKKILLFCILYAVTFSVYAQTCPSVREIFHARSDGQYDLVPPSGWLVVMDKRNRYSNDIRFLIAAWGDHKHNYDSVRCHYFKTQPHEDDHIQLETQERFNESAVADHRGWAMGSDHLYYMCGHDAHGNVNECAFN